MYQYQNYPPGTPTGQYPQSQYPPQAQTYYQQSQRIPNQPPPAKRQKGNPIVTHYPPPPGYVPPTNPQLALNTWQSANNQPQFSHQFQPGYHQNARSPTTLQGFTPNYPQVNNWAQPQHQQHQVQHHAPLAQSFTQHSVQQYNAQYPVQNGASPSQYGPPGLYPSSQMPGQLQAPPYGGQAFQKPRLPSAPFIQTQLHSPQNHSPIFPPFSQSAPQTRAPSISISAPTESVHGADNGDDDEPPAHEFDETDYTREASFARDQDGLVAELSLGIIVYIPPRSVKTALASTFKEAEFDQVTPSVREGESESISRYFVNSELYQVKSNVKQYPNWENMKSNMIFREFPSMEVASWTSLSELKSTRDRPDEVVELEESSIPNDTIDYKASVSDHVNVLNKNGKDEPLGIPANINDDEAMDLTSGDDDDEEENGVQATTNISVLNEEQEDILAALGVTGPPKPVSHDLAITFDETDLNYANQTHSEEQTVPVLSIPPKQADNSHSANDNSTVEDTAAGPPKSPPPGRTTARNADSDMDGDHDKTPRASSINGTKTDSGKKRRYEEMERSNASDGRRRQEDDNTPKVRRMRPKLPEAYSRRNR